jgi:hypothetical protein
VSTERAEDVREGGGLGCSVSWAAILFLGQFGSGIESTKKKLG